MSYPDYAALPSFKARFDTNATLAYEAFAFMFFLDHEISPGKNYSTYQAGAVCGNLQQESEFNPDIAGDAHIVGGSNGIAQWNDGPKHDTVHGRYSTMKAYVAKLLNVTDYTTLTMQQKFWGQLHFIDHEIHSPQYKKALAVLINDEMDSDLAGKFGHIYEGFGDNSSAKRDNYAKALIATYNTGKFSNSTPKVGLRLDKPPVYTLETFARFLSQLDLKKLEWSPKFITLHNTYIPTMAQYLAYSDAVEEQWPNNLNQMYKKMGWHSGPHMVCTPHGQIVELCNLLQDGVHASCFNRTSFGIEMVGDFEHEDWNSGPGLIVQNTAIEVLALLHNKFGWDPVPYVYNVKGLHFHKECLHDGHPCPGKNVDKAALITKVQARMKELKQSVPVKAKRP